MRGWMRKVGLALACVLAVPIAARAYVEFATPGGPTVVGTLFMWLDAAGKAVPWGPVVAQNRSVALSLGNQAQQIMGANPYRRCLEIQNLSTSDVWIDETGVAVQDMPSRWINAGGSWMPPWWAIPSGAISVIGPVTGQKIMAREC